MNPRAGQGRTRTWGKSVWTQPGAGGADTTRESGSDARTAACTAQPPRARCAAQGAQLRAPQRPGGVGCGLGAGGRPKREGACVCITDSLHCAAEIMQGKQLPSVKTDRKLRSQRFRCAARAAAGPSVNRAGGGGPGPRRMTRESPLPRTPGRWRRRLREMPARGYTVKDGCGPWKERACRSAG